LLGNREEKVSQILNTEHWGMGDHFGSLIIPLMQILVNINIYHKLIGLHLIDKFLTKKKCVKILNACVKTCSFSSFQQKAHLPSQLNVSA